MITGFLGQGKLVAKSQGLPDLGLAEYPGTMMTDSLEQLKEKVDTAVVENVIHCLTAQIRASAPEEAKAEEPNQRDIVFRGDIWQVHEHFYRNLWTDGLPIIPPTIPAVEAFLRYTNRAPEEVLAFLPHENREATIWNIAVNGVMAGCRPEYMPILIALTEAVADTGTPGNPMDQGFRVQDVGTTPGWEPLIIINGPIIKELDFNYGQGVMRFGRQANTSIGRFLKLLLRNVGGFRIPPGDGDKGSIAQSPNVVLAENEDAVAELGWLPFNTDKGFEAGENTVTVMSSVGISAPVYSSGSTAQEHLETIAEIIGRRTWRLWSIFAVHTLRFEPLLLMSPSVAKILAKDGWTKQMIRQYLFDNVRTTPQEIEKQAMDFNGIYLDLCEKVEKGLLSPDYCKCNDPLRDVKVFPKPESIQIVISGDPNRNQSKGFIQNGYLGAPTTKRIVLPDDWNERINKDK